MPESSYNAPRLHVAMQARKIVISGEVAGLQIQLGPPAVLGRFDSCDLPPKIQALSNIFNLSIIFSLLVSIFFMRFLSIGKSTTFFFFINIDPPNLFAHYFMDFMDMALGYIFYIT